MEREKRVRKEKVYFSSDLYDEAEYFSKLERKNRREQERVRLSNNAGNPDSKKVSRCRNRSSDANAENVWDKYRKVVKKLVFNISREMHFIEVYSNTKRDSHQNTKSNPMAEEINKCHQRIMKAKQSILDAFHLMARTHEGHKQWPELDQSDDDGMVDLELIMCSRCNLGDEEDNDIFICDRTGCLRAYHQKCLDPPIALDVIDPEGNDDWFCWQCECIDDCLGLINEFFESNNDDWRVLFPEVAAAEGQSSEEFSEVIKVEDDEEDESDEDYIEEDGDDEINSSGSSTEKSDSSDSDFDENEGAANEEDVDREDPTDQSIDHDEELVKSESESDSFAGSQGSNNSENDSDIDDDEIAALLKEAGDDIGIIDVEASAGSRYIFRNQRHVINAVMKEPSGGEDVGRKVAKASRGYLVIGDITAFHTASISSSNASATASIDAMKVSPDKFDSMGTEVESTKGTLGENVNPSEDLQSMGQWDVVFNDRSTLSMNFTAVRHAMQLYHYFETKENERQAREEDRSRRNENEVMQGNDGILHEENIIDSKRRRKEIDYALLSLELFGNLASDDENDEDEYNMSKMRSRHFASVKNRQVSGTNNGSPAPTKAKRARPSTRKGIESGISGGKPNGRQNRGRNKKDLQSPVDTRTKFTIQHALLNGHVLELNLKSPRGSELTIVSRVENMEA